LRGEEEAEEEEGPLSFQREGEGVDKEELSRPAGPLLSKEIFAADLA
jgi:hypothetical protein